MEWNQIPCLTLKSHDQCILYTNTPLRSGESQWQIYLHVISKEHDEPFFPCSIQFTNTDMTSALSFLTFLVKNFKSASMSRFVLNTTYTSDSSEQPSLKTLLLTFLQFRGFTPIHVPQSILICRLGKRLLIFHLSPYDWGLCRSKPDSGTSESFPQAVQAEHPKGTRHVEWMIFSLWLFTGLQTIFCLSSDLDSNVWYVSPSPEVFKNNQGVSPWGPIKSLSVIWYFWAEKDILVQSLKASTFRPWNLIFWDSVLAL